MEEERERDGMDLYFNNLTIIKKIRLVVVHPHSCLHSILLCLHFLVAFKPAARPIGHHVHRCRSQVRTRPLIHSHTSRPSPKNSNEPLTPFF